MTFTPQDCPRCGAPLNTLELTSGDQIECKGCGTVSIFNNPFENTAESDSEQNLGEIVSSGIWTFVVAILSVGILMIELAKWAILPQTPLFLIGISLITFVAASIVLVITLTKPVADTKNFGASVAFMFMYASHQIMTQIFSFNTYVATFCSIPLLLTALGILLLLRFLRR
jgi:hypothetical protein